MAKAVALRHFLHLRAWIGGSDETLSRFRCADGLLHFLVEILFEDIRFERSSGLTRNDKNSFGDVDLAFQRPDLSRIGGIEDMNLRIPIFLPESFPKHFDAKARAAHTQQNEMREAGVMDLVSNLFEIGVVSNLFFGDSQPAQPVALVLVSPK